MNRRTFLATGASAALSAAPQRAKFGIATTCYLSVWKPKDTLEFLDHAIKSGAAGIQAPLTSLEPNYVRTLRSRLEQNGMYFEVMSGLPKGDPAQFEKTLTMAKEAGARCVRSACLSGRRYETFGRLEDWKTFVVNSNDAIESALKVAEKLKLPLAIENHKDWTVDEFVELLRFHNNPLLGVCLDTGNNMALLDDPYEVVERLAPYAVSTHIKDMAVAPYEEGFYLSEMVLGKGMLDIPRILSMIQKARPNTPFTLEMITRDPLPVPCLTEYYWATFPKRNGVYLARMLRTVRDKPQRLPKLSGLDPAAQRKLEDDNVQACLRYS